MNRPASFCDLGPLYVSESQRQNHQVAANRVFRGAMDLIQQQLLGWATKGLSPEKLKRARYDGVVLKVWRPVGDR
jgi:hypothetical protein